MNSVEVVPRSGHKNDMEAMMMGLQVKNACMPQGPQVKQPEPYINEFCSPL
jgi:hypothetical protein